MKAEINTCSVPIQDISFELSIQLISYLISIFHNFLSTIKYLTPSGPDPLQTGSTQWATKHSLHWIQKWIHDLQSAGPVVTDITKNCTSFLLISGRYGSPLLLLITPYMFLLFSSLIQQNILIFFLFFLFFTGLPLRSLTRKNAWLSLLQQELLSILLRVKNM